MSEEIPDSSSALIAAPPVPADAPAFLEHVQVMLDGQVKEDAVVTEAFKGLDSMFDLIAAGLYNLASMLVGEGEDSVRLVEIAVATAEIAACTDPVQARQSCRTALSAAALDLIVERNPASLAAPAEPAPVMTCIEDDDLDAAGVSREEFERMIAGPDRARVRNWLASLPQALRTVFVLRAVAGFTSAETASLLSRHGGSNVAGWSPEDVREYFRQGLCSLASQLIQASTTR